MTGEQANQDDDLFDDDSFIVEGLDENLDSAFEEVEQEARMNLPPEMAAVEQDDDLFALDEEPDAAQAEDLLFQSDHATAEAWPETSPFQERDGSGWPGATMSTDQIGIPAEGVGHQSFAEDEVQEVDLDMDDLDIVEMESGHGLDEDGHGEDDTREEYQEQDEFELEGEQPSDAEVFDEEWAQPGAAGLGELNGLEPDADEEIGEDQGFYAEDLDAGDSQLLPAEEEAVDQDWAAEPEIYAEDQDDAAADAPYDEQEQAYEEEPDYAEHEESYVDAAAPIAVVPGPRRRFASRMLTAAIVLISLSAVGVVYVKPEWIGLTPLQVAVDVTRVDRPEAPVDVSIPTLGIYQLGGTVKGGQTEGESETVAGLYLPPLNAETARTAVAGLGSMLRTASEKLLNLQDQGGRTPTPNDADPLPLQTPTIAGIQRTSNELGQVDIGGELRIGGRYQVDVAPVPSSTFTEGVMVGTRAVAQLHNGNYFVGTVKTLGEASVTMKLDRGEVTFDFPELHMLTALGSAEYDELQKVDRGFVRLSNRNRLVGSIVRKAVGDQVVLETQSSRIVIPRSAIEEIGSAGTSMVHVRSEDDAEWVRSVVDQMLEKPAVKPVKPQDR